MIKEAKELGIKVINAGLLSVEDFNKYAEKLPTLPGHLCWWLADYDSVEGVAYAEGNYREEDFFVDREYPNTYLRIALDIRGGGEGEQFIFYGIVFTALSENLAISNNVLGMVKYYDKELLDYIVDENPTCTINAVIGALFPYDAFEN